MCAPRAGNPKPSLTDDGGMQYPFNPHFKIVQSFQTPHAPGNLISLELVLFSFSHRCHFSGKSNKAKPGKKQHLLGPKLSLPQIGDLEQSENRYLKVPKSLANHYHYVSIFKFFCVPYTVRGFCNRLGRYEVNLATQIVEYASQKLA